MWTAQALFKLEDQNGPVERQCLSQRVFSAGWGQKGAPTISMAQMRSWGVKILKALAKVREKKSERGAMDLRFLELQLWDLIQIN